MARRKIVKLGEEVLRMKSKPVDKIDRRLLSLLNDMADTMYAADGVGLAAPQVGILKRVVVIDVGEGLLELINPEIVRTEGSQINAEGCLSVPGRQGIVERPTKVVVNAYNREGQQIEVTGTDLLAIALCHEIDHLDGIVYVDKMIEDVTDKAEK